VLIVPGTLVPTSRPPVVHRPKKPEHKLQRYQ
jgi:hypothetical protein